MTYTYPYENKSYAVIETSYANNIACEMIMGTFNKDTKLSLMRGSKIIYSGGTINNFKKFNKDVDEVKIGETFGIVMNDKTWIVNHKDILIEEISK